MSGTTRRRRPAVEPRWRGRRLRPRHLWLVPGLAIAIFANELGKGNGVGILALVAFGIAPDLPRLFGSARAACAQPAAPADAAPVAAVADGGHRGIVPVAWLVGSLVWLGHVIAGRGVGDVPRRGGDRPNA